MVKLNLHALYSGLTMVHTQIVLCVYQQRCGIRASYHSRQLHFAYFVSYVHVGSHNCADQELFFVFTKSLSSCRFATLVIIVD